MNSDQKKFSEIFISIFILSFILINWSDVSWMFNYREVSGLASAFFNPYQEGSTLLAANTIAIHNNAKPPSVQTAKQYPYTSAQNSLLIPVISVNTPVVVAVSSDQKALTRDLDKGAVYYPGSVLPGEHGQIVVLGHSAPPNWPRIKYDYIFSDIEKLEIGQEIILNFNNRQYTYKVRDKKIVKPGQEVGQDQLTGSNNILTLVSCWPPGKDYQRIAVTAELVK